ncbi:ABC transporter ATP-binding protein [Roseimaritima ulvae]|uniref:SkfA peptide export ATP-binding protein SkfE n=1 Tax=Roseimaritima ulvae TaxID=980254 RepID=A0A5B9QWN5_9BACT|nr:ABC transporter ATP-binding protein [Roseimaritima ulvae]QEG42319.1 SkfA peptide export ATP-binding protein SkfE [Roseimaritima ulvae]
MIYDEAIVARGLTRYYGRTAVARELNFVVPRGSVTALLGLNGAGKTTTIRMLMGLLAPTRGHSSVLGCDSQRLQPDQRAKIGYMVEGHYLLPWMRVGDYAGYSSAGYSFWDSKLFNAIVREFGIEPSMRAGRLSRGQRAGVSLALTLAGDPELLILDDPALGLDPVSSRALNETLLQFAGRDDRTILLSSHSLNDVERVADRVLVMVDGKLKVDAALDEFTRRVGCWRLHSNGGQSGSLRSIAGLIDSRRVGESEYQITVADPDQETIAAIHRLDPAAERSDPSFDEAVVAYLSRHRRGSSFLQPVVEG